MIQVYKNPALRILESDPDQKWGQDIPVSLSIAFYNNWKMLELTLAGVSKQTFRPFQVIICDDGSKPEIVQKLKDYLDHFPIPTLHLWHEDKGFRKNRILNWGIHYSPAEILIFIDQDCVPHPEFIREHYENRKKKTVLCGRRMDLTPLVSQLLTPQKIQQGFLQSHYWWILLQGLYMKDNNGGKGFYLRSAKMRKLVNQKPRGIVGCNFSIWKEDLLAINGFDYRYEGAGTGEDSDIQYRLQLQGVQMEPFCNTAVQYHIWHPLLNRPNENEKIFEEVKKQVQAITLFGLKEQLAGK